MSRRPDFDPQRATPADDALESERFARQLGPIARARPLRAVNVGVTETRVPHGLGRVPGGWFEVSPQSSSPIYQTQDPDQFVLFLRADVARKATLAVF